MPRVPPQTSTTGSGANADPVISSATPAPMVIGRPAGHYHMGGIAVDAEGRSSVAGHWACGEAASSGLRGAKRLAGNVLTGAVVTAGWVVRSVAGTHAGRPMPLTHLAMPARPDPASTRRILPSAMGVLQLGERLREAMATPLPLATGDSPASDPAAVGLMMAVFASRHEERRGAHSRSAKPNRTVAACRSQLTLTEAITTAVTLAGLPLPGSA